MKLTLRHSGFLVGILLLASATATAEPYQNGDSFVGFKAPDQKGESVVFKAGDARFVLFETPGESGQADPPKDPDWFTKNQALMVVNISEFSGFKQRIARSRMKSRPFQILVVDEAPVAARFPKQEGRFTVLRLDPQGVITAIQYAAAGKELQDLVTTPTP